MQDISATSWNALAGGAGPFLRHEFLAALEASDSVARSTGWQPYHVTVHDHDELIAAMPLYVKHHSYGEYVFDWSWADAYRRYGKPYYPKLLTAIPFTPSQGSRLLVKDAQVQSKVLPLLVDTIRGYTQQGEFSSWHLLFPHPDDADGLDQTGLIRREGCQYHWHNRGYDSFDDFLAQFSSRKRKNLRKERLSINDQGLSFHRIHGADIDQHTWDIFYRFYQNTYQIRGQHGYLTRDFFSRLASQMPENVLLIMVKHHDRYVAGALFLYDEHSLFGRYWGCEADFHNLHFETCYYQGIEFCIEKGLTLFDAGAQGEHKLRRGFEPVRTLSYHWIEDPAFRHAIADYCQQESLHVTEFIDSAETYLPFKKSLTVDDQFTK